ncbi:sporulation protein [Thiorhodococcus mannitoliphagus]|uniref:Sporulation protein n=1 Tax=Thiorhodococcus mannitoliphagus TaxID=329406 RepID=A0A6P1E0M1_9GAMM|nr:AAA family ATPase [Thiorhodococcus mannitoliphagus]NEX22586.1 sporulation protein [Thiorhodococcus mannitoliphagus]
MPLDAECLAQLKLRQQPFDEFPSEDFLYSDPLLESLVETASHALQAPGAIVILAGAEGSGRSIQLMRLLGAVEDGLELIAFRGRANIPFDAIDVTIRNHLRGGGIEDPQRPLAALLSERARAGSAVVLAIDDAHLIGQESIERLLRVRGEVLESGRQGLRLILVGDQSFGRGSLPLPDPVDGGQVVRLNLRPFNLEQARAYLRHRLRVAGVDDPESFLSTGDIAVLQTNSKGLPRLLNRSANAWLERRCRSAGGLSQAVTRKLGGLAPGAKSTRTFEEPPDQELRALVDAGQAEPEGILDFDAEPAPPSAYSDPELSRYLVGEDTKPAGDDFEQILKHVRQHQLSQAPTNPSELKAAQTERPPKSALWNRPWLIPLILALVVLSILIPVGLQLMGGGSEPSPSARQPAPPAFETDAPIVEEPPSDNAGAKPEVQAAEQAQAVEAEGEVTPESEAATPDTTASETPEGSDAVKAEDAEPESERLPAESSPEPDVGKDQMSEHLDWLARQDAERYTIQLVAGRDLATSMDFLAPFDLGGIHYIQTRTYVIGVFGSFPNRAAAARMLPDLPKAVRENGPWIRTIGSVRDSLP